MISLNTLKIYCCECKGDVDAKLTTGSEVYPHRRDLHSLPFWKCETCNNYVGCHHKTKNRTRPLGNIPNPDMRKARMHIHEIIDPLWRSGRISRSKLYSMISHTLGYEYHTGEIKDLEEARTVYRIIQKINEELEHESVG